MEGLNQRLWNFCGGMGVDFVDLRPVLGSCRLPLNVSGVHYKTESNDCVARRILDHYKYFLEK